MESQDFRLINFCGINIKKENENSNAFSNIKKLHSVKSVSADIS